MYEPLLQVAVPDHHVGSFRRPARSLEGQTRKVVLIAQAWNYPIAERNAAQIAGYLLQSGKVGLLALGDYGKNSQISLPPPIKSSLEDLQKRARQAEDDLTQRKITIADYINATGLNPGVPMVGVNNETLLQQGFEAGATCQLYMMLLTALGNGIPILTGLHNHLAAAKQMHASPFFHRSERLFEHVYVNGETEFLPQLLQLASEVGLEMDYFPHLAYLKRYAEGEGLNPRDNGRAHHWLRQAVLSRLVEGKIDPRGGLKALFEVEMRQIVRTGVDARRLLSSDRPLYHCAEQAQSELVESIAESIEANEDSNVRLTQRLLDLASIFGLNDRYYAQYRRLVGIKSSGFSIPQLDEYHSELADLATALFNNSIFSNEEVKIYTLGQRLIHLEKLAKGELSPEQAKRILAYPPSAQEILTGLRDLHVELTSTEMGLAELFDTLCLPLARAFQESSLSQAKVMANNLLAEMSTNDCEAAVLICGGFHPQGVAQELAKNEQAVCSIIAPELYDKPKEEHTLDPQKMREEARHGRFSIHLLGGIRSEAAKLAKKNIGDGDENTQDSTSSLNSDRESDARMWSEGYYQNILVEQMLTFLHKEESGGSLQECRVCHRQAPLEERAIICPPGNAPYCVLICQLCERFVCTRCAGYGPVALYPGYATPRARRSDSEIGILVCNIHGEPLGDKDNTLLIGEGMAGHSLQWQEFRSAWAY